VLGDVTIYNGVSWGWTSTFTPRKASDYPGDDGGCTGDSGGGGCESANAFYSNNGDPLVSTTGFGLRLSNTRLRKIRSAFPVPLTDSSLWLFTPHSKSPHKLL
jgi:hypothetical protein